MTPSVLAELAGRPVESLSRLERKWLKVRHCGFCEAPLLGRSCYALSGLYDLPIVKGVRDKEETVDLGPPCDMDQMRAKALATYNPRARASLLSSKSS